MALCQLCLQHGAGDVISITGVPFAGRAAKSHYAQLAGGSVCIELGSRPRTLLSREWYICHGERALAYSEQIPALFLSFLSIQPQNRQALLSTISRAVWTIHGQSRTGP
jgi:hypothetical protein